LWRQGHQTFSGFIKARERPGKGGGFWGRRNRKINPKTKKKAKKIEQKTENKDSSKTQKRPQQQRRRGRKSEGGRQKKTGGGRTNQNRNCFPCFFSENRDEEK